jgi:hypothetical protein
MMAIWDRRYDLYKNKRVVDVKSPMDKITPENLLVDIEFEYQQP